MGEIVEAMAYLFVGIFWLLSKAYEKSTGKDLGLWGAIFLLMVAALLCSGVIYLIVTLLF
jgi:hypothetical protein